MMTSLRAVIALVGGVTLILGGCATGGHRNTVAAPAACAIVSNGTPAPKPNPHPAPPTRTANWSVDPAAATGYRRDMTAAHTRTYAAATTNPLATEAACDVLRDGGTAADAIVAAQTVLGLVEPQSSGIGGGGFLLYYNAPTGTVHAYDGRETAPAAADENYLRWISATDRHPPRPDTRASGRSIGVPGIVRLLEEVHRQFGSKDWRVLFAPAVSMAAKGFDVSPQLAAAIDAEAPRLRLNPAAAAYFLNRDGSPKPPGTRMTNPAYAKTLSAISADGSRAFYTGDTAKAIVAATADTTAGRTPGLLTEADLAGYTVEERQPLCTTYRGRDVCGMPPPSSGGLAVAATLGILEHFDLGADKPTDIDLDGGRPTVLGVHLVTEAERLAYADRDRYVADTDFVALPGGSPETLLDSAYLTGRAALISKQHSMGTAQPGAFGPPVTIAPTVERGTSHISVIDKYGNAAALTTTIESPFGSAHMIDGFLLNNQLTDFSAEPDSPEGEPLANRIQPGKRPRSTMAPTLMFDHPPGAPPRTRGSLYAVLGSSGGSSIVQFVVKTIIGITDWGLDPQQAVSMVDFGAANSTDTDIGGEHPLVDVSDNGTHDPLIGGLRALGHHVVLTSAPSGLSALVRAQPAGWAGGADPRRAGLVMGDPG